MNKNMILIIMALLVVVAGYLILNYNSDQNLSDPNKLSQVEVDNLYYIREEEKLAYDVYQTLGDKWAIQSFQNISNSEERHQSKVVMLLTKYGLEDKAKNLEVGKFNNSILQKIYTELVLVGEKSLLDALYVGATIEILDIKDLDKMIEETEKQDLEQVFENLKSGSQNHLEAFKKQISRFENFDENKLIKIEENKENNMQNNKVSIENSLIVDVRTRGEFVSGNFPGSINIPLDEVAVNLEKFKNTDKQNIILVCRSGARAGQAEQILKSSGITKNIVNLGPWQNLSD